MGALVGRVANRIARGHFVVEGKEYQLHTNNGPNALHGGLRGFNKVKCVIREYVGATWKGKFGLFCKTLSRILRHISTICLCIVKGPMWVGV